MSTQWGLDWRKLYRRPSQEWLALPLSVRGFGDELIRYADDDGQLFVGTEVPANALSRLMGAHPRERKWVETSLAHLLADGFAVLTNGRITIRNFIKAQGSVGPSGERMRKLRAEKPATENPTGPGLPQLPSGSPLTTVNAILDDAPTKPDEFSNASRETPTEPSAQKDSGAVVTVTSLARASEIRSDQIRQDPPTPVEIRPDPKPEARPTPTPVRPPTPEPPDWDAIKSALTRGAGTKFDGDCPFLAADQLTAFVRQCGYTAADLEMLGRDFAKHPPKWLKTPAVDVPFLLGYSRDGVPLVQLMTAARGRKRTATPAALSAAELERLSPSQRAELERRKTPPNA